MIALQRTLSLGYLRQHRTRTGLVILSIALGVATLVATRLLNQTLQDAAGEAVNPLARMSDLVLINAQTGVPRRLAGELLKADIPGLRDAQPLVLGRVLLPDLGPNGRSVLLLGWSSEEALRPNEQQEDSWGIKQEWTANLVDVAMLTLRRQTPVLLGERLAQELRESGPGADRHFRVLAASKTHELAPVGVVHFRGEVAPEAGSLIMMDAASASRLVFPRRPEYVTFINVRLEPGADREQVRQYIDEYVGDQADVLTVEENIHLVQDVTAGLELGFNLGGVGALVVGLFLVYNALAVSVAERRHDIGILRAVGATRLQIVRLFLGEAACLGLAGACLGVPLGWLLGWLALSPMQRILTDVIGPQEMPRLHLSPALAVAASLAGIVTALLAALLPALQAAEEEPAAAVRHVPVSARLGYRLLHVATVLLLLAGGLACVLGRKQLPPARGVFGGMVLFLLAGLVATPLLTGLLGRLLQPLFRTLLGLEGRLAADNLVRSPGRTGIVIAALAATGALVLQMAGFIHSTETAVHDWVDTSVAADLFVTCGGSVAGLAQPTDERIGKELRSLPEVKTVVGVRFHLLIFRNRPILLVAIDTDAFDPSDRPHARNLSHHPRLRQGGAAIVSENFASLYGIQPGDSITIRGPVPAEGQPRKTIELEAIAERVDYTWNRGSILVDRAWFRREFADNQVDVWDVYLRPGSDPEAVRQKVEQRWGKSEGLHAQTRTQAQQAISDGIRRIYYLAYAQQFVVGLVSLLGVASALFISVLQRRRELGLLRAVGATRGQVLGTVLAEASLMGVIGAVIGFGVGVLLEWYVVGVILVDEAGFRFPMLVPWRAAVGVFGLSIVLATLVGLWPAYLATRLRITEAIAYE
jgi:putative ABC transport system permease protein